MKNFFKKIPGWVMVLFIFGLLYTFGLHTEVLGQIQRVILLTGIHNVDVPHEQSSEDIASNLIPEENEKFMLQKLSGETIDFDELKGKVVFLNLWATWCPPCIAEMPDIQELYNEMKDENIAFVMLSVDTKGTDKVKKFIDKKKFTFPVYLLENGIPDKFSSNVIPTTFIISKDGEVVSRQEGMASYNTNEFKEYLRKLINGE